MKCCFFGNYNVFTWSNFFNQFLCSRTKDYWSQRPTRHLRANHFTFKGTILSIFRSITFRYLYFPYKFLFMLLIVSFFGVALVVSREDLPWWLPCLWGSAGRSCSVAGWLCPLAPCPICALLWERRCLLSAALENCLPMSTQTKNKLIQSTTTPSDKLATWLKWETGLR